ncbi:AhpC/TSA family protein [Spiractinospora alimapuensis]|uniref:peroxiredoxin-like family protein n=1 Tax=Spiractinospora alimapuensis TaxID=2820884 RepID=UPI001F4144AF|nr:peroxiredoxin-like family protein [Spiractinospora alimapuensis]QVQ51193.1 AhpC/TSA family protein [Spiractinospora alimapuensis]
MNKVSALELTTVTGERVEVPDRERLTHLQFRRFAGCPICNLHLRTVIQRHDEIEAAGIREVVLFHSPAEALRDYDLPFAVIPDPEKRHYRAFGVESSRRALLHPRTWLAILRGSGMILSGSRRPPALHQPGGRQGMPADFLIATDGRIVASKHGEHAYDQWSVDELLAHAETENP